MTDLIPVSYAELVRSGVHALRGLGLSFSSAERGAHTLASTEAATGLALRTLRLNRDPIGQRDRLPIQVSESAVGVLRVNARGRSMLEMAPLLVDALAADAHRNGSAALLAENCPHLPFLVDLAVRSRHLPHTVLCLYQGATQNGFTRGGFIGDRDRLHGGALSAEAFAAIATSSLIQRFNAGPLVNAFDAGNDGVLLLASGDGTASHESFLSDAFTCSNARSWQDASTWFSSISEGIKNQILVSRPDFEFFTRCVARVWVPTSERSRAQQG